MDPNKRGNPPFEPSSYAAGLERRVRRHEEFRRTVMEHLESALYEERDSEGVNEARRWFESLKSEQVVPS